jgi:hypothetical protein
MENGKMCDNQLQETGKKLGHEGAKKKRETPATGKYRGTLMDNGKMCDNQLQETGKKSAEKRRETPATGKYRGTLMDNGKSCDNQLQQSGKELGHEFGHMGRTTDFVRVRVSHLTQRKEIKDIAFLSGSLKATHGNDPSSAMVTIQKQGAGNAILYLEMCAKFNKEKNKKKYKKAANLPTTTLTLASKPGTSLKDVMSLLETCSSDKPVGFFRRSRGKGGLLQPNEVAEWKFEVVEFKPADEKIAETTKRRNVISI